MRKITWVISRSNPTHFFGEIHLGNIPTFHFGFTTNLKGLLQMNETLVSDEEMTKVRHSINAMYEIWKEVRNITFPPPS